MNSPMGSNIFNQAHYSESDSALLYSGFPQTLSSPKEASFSALLSADDSILQSQDDKDMSYYQFDATSTYLQTPISLPPTSDSFDTYNVPRTLSPTIGRHYLSIPTTMYQPSLDYSPTSATVPSASHTASSIQSATSSANGSPYCTPVDLWSGMDNSYNQQWETEAFINPTILPSNVYSRSQSPASPTVQRSGKIPSYPRTQSPRHQPYPISRPTSVHGGSNCPSPAASTLVPSPIASPIAFNDESFEQAGSKSPSVKETGNPKETLCVPCGKKFRDFKAHMLTHQDERPEKCPIVGCKYNRKGFARKYDCQRHTLTHYKGTMVCGFCPGSGSAAEKSFNRADVFKRHLTSVHNVEQNPPNTRKKGVPVNMGESGEDGMLSTIGKCSTCGLHFANAQNFYEHLDDCVLQKVVEEEPAANINDLHLSGIKEEDIDPSIYSRQSTIDELSNDEDAYATEDMDTEEAKDELWTTSANSLSSRRRKPTSGSGIVSKPISSTISCTDGKPTSAISKAKRFGGKGIGRGKKRKNWPPSWGEAPEKMVNKRRCLKVFDGVHFLTKDVMLMHEDLETKVPIGGEAYISNVDYWAMGRAQVVAEAAQ